MADQNTSESPVYELRSIIELRRLYKQREHQRQLYQRQQTVLSRLRNATNVTAPAEVTSDISQQTSTSGRTGTATQTTSSDIHNHDNGGATLNGGKMSSSSPDGGEIPSKSRVIQELEETLEETKLDKQKLQDEVKELRAYLVDKDNEILGLGHEISKLEEKRNDEKNELVRVKAELERVKSELQKKENQPRDTSMVNFASTMTSPVDSDRIAAASAHLVSTKEILGKILEGLNLSEKQLQSLTDKVPDVAAVAGKSQQSDTRTNKRKKPDPPPQARNLVAVDRSTTVALPRRVDSYGTKRDDSPCHWEQSEQQPHPAAQARNPAVSESSSTSNRSWHRSRWNFGW